jgi:transposase
VRCGFESGRPIAHVAVDLGISSEVLRRHVRRAEADQGLRPDLPTSAERDEARQLRRENFELRRANEILKSHADSFIPWPCNFSSSRNFATICSAL